MKITTTFLQVMAVAVFLLAANKGNGQIYSYTIDSVGNYNTVATNASGNALGRINGATAPTPACHVGFSSKTFPTTATYASTVPADTMSVAPNSGYQLNVTGFTVDIRRSPTGPQNVRYAYRLDNTATWIDQGSDHSPNNAGCDTLITANWTTSLTVAYPRKLIFAVFGFNAGTTSGTFQIENLQVNGTVGTASTAGIQSAENDPDNFSVYPNPSSGNVHISYVLNGDENVSLSIYNVLGQQVSFISNELQRSGSHDYQYEPAAPGIYFARLTIGDKMLSRKFVKM